MEETQVRLAKELSGVCRDYYDMTWDKALTVARVPADSVWRLLKNVYYHTEIRMIPAASSLLAPAPESSEQPLAIPDAAKVKEVEVETQEVDPKAKDAPTSQPSQKEDPPTTTWPLGFFFFFFW